MAKLPCARAKFQYTKLRDHSRGKAWILRDMHNGPFGRRALELSERLLGGDWHRVQTDISTQSLGMFEFPPPHVVEQCLTA